MYLAIFDIDGTLVNSVAIDDECFIQTFKDLYQIDLLGVDWNDFEHVTDSGLTNEIFLNHLSRLPTAFEIDRIQEYFFGLLSSRSDEFEEIPGASKFLERLEAQPNIAIAFATGGWKKTALLKLRCLNFQIEDCLILSADDHFNRAEITKLAIEAVTKKYRINKLEAVTYIGDGLWDLKAAQELNINFIGIDCKNSGKLNAQGGKNVIKDYLTANETMVTKKARYEIWP